MGASKKSAINIPLLETTNHKRCNNPWLLHDSDPMGVAVQKDPKDLYRSKFSVKNSSIFFY
jgi:hypothetical protein